jgi:hypothetical protein
MNKLKKVRGFQSNTREHKKITTPHRAGKDELTELLSQAVQEIHNGYLVVRRSKNPELFKILAKYHFFDFHCTNRYRQLVGVHQIALYIDKGWARYYYTGRCCVKGQLEVHHLDHNKLNNDPKNLWYVTPTENKVLADITRVCLNKSQSLYSGMAKFDLDNIYFQRDVSLNFPDLLIQTLIATSQNFLQQDWDFLQTLLDNLPFKQAKELLYLCKNYLIKKPLAGLLT